MEPIQCVKGYTVYRLQFTVVLSGFLPCSMQFDYVDLTDTYVYTSLNIGRFHIKQIYCSFLRSLAGIDWLVKVGQLLKQTKKYDLWKKVAPGLSNHSVVMAEFILVINIFNLILFCGHCPQIWQRFWVFWGVIFLPLYEDTNMC